MVLQIKFGQRKQQKQQSMLGLSDYSRKPEAPVAIAEARTELHAKPAEDVVAPVKAPPVHPRLKTYLTNSVREAMQMASRDMGDDAVLIQSEPVVGNPEGRFRVTCGSMNHSEFDGLFHSRVSASEPSEPPEDVSPTDAPEQKAGTETERELRLELEALRQDFAALRDLVFRSQLNGNGTPPVTNAAAPIQAELVSHGVDAEVASQWLAGMQSDPDREPGTTQADSLIAHLAQSIETDDALDRPAVFIGPSGSGKTTALLKLALARGVRQGRQVQIVTIGQNVDTKLTAIAGLLEIPLRNLASPEGLAAAIDESHSSGMLTLIDAPNIPAGARRDAEEVLAASIRQLDASVHLTLPATWGGANIRHAMERFELFSPTHLLFTMVDQTVTPGVIIEHAWRSKKRLSFITRGPMGTGSIDSASLTSLVTTCLDTRPESVAAGSLR